MKPYVEIDGYALLLILLAYGGLCGMGGALLLGPKFCAPIATITQSIDR